VTRPGSCPPAISAADAVDLDTAAQAARDACIAVGRSQVRRILLAEKVRWRRTFSASRPAPTRSPHRKGPHRGALHRAAA
jgi:hypothetical protein